MASPTKHLKVTELTQFVSDTLSSGATVRRLAVEQYLFLEVRARTQSASWVFRYSFAGVKTSQGFGKFPGVGLVEAREKARTAREMLVQGVSPVEAKRTGLQAAGDRHKRPVVLAVEEWLKADIKKLTSPKYAAQKAQRLRDVLDYRGKSGKSRPLGGMPVSTVTTENITDALDVFLLPSKDREKPAHETARRVLADLEKAFDWSRGKGWRSEANPCSGVGVIIERPAKQGRRAPGLAALGDVVRGLRAVLDTRTKDFEYDTRLALLLLLTGARTSEVRLATWDEVIDLDGNTPRIEVPAGRMKKRKDWTIPLSTQAVGLLRELRDNAAKWGIASPNVFHKYRAKGRANVVTENGVNLVLLAAGWHSALTGHGFRQLLSTAAYSLWPYRGNNRERAIEHSLAHVNSQTVEQTYNKAEFLAERLQLLQWWADHLDRVATASPGGNVLEFQRAAVSA